MRIVDIYLNRKRGFFSMMPYGHRRLTNMKAMKKDLAGVSPVIAVILMVAITVVLAGVVFLWAQSFTEDAGGGAQTVSVDLELSDDGAAVTELTITPLRGDIQWADYKLIFNGHEIDTSALVTSTVGIDEVIDVDGTNYVVPAAYAALTVGQEYNVKMIYIEDQSVVLNTNVVCKTG
jgi:flagellin-like protein